MRGNGNNYFNANLGSFGIGNNNPSYLLDVTGTFRNTTSAYLASSSGTVSVGITPQTDKLFVYNASGTNSALTIQQDGTGNILQVNGNSGAARLTITQAGNVGIGTSSPSYLLDLQTGYSTNKTLLRLGNNTASAANGDKLNIDFFSYNDNYINARISREITDYTTYTGALTFWTGASNSITEKLRISVEGNLLVTSGATIYNSSGSLYLRAGTSGNLLLGAGGNNSLVTITSGGNVGIGTTSPDTTFTVKGTAIGNGLGKASFYGGGDENNWSATNNEAIRIGRSDILGAYYSSIWSASGSGANETQHWLRFYISTKESTVQNLALTLDGAGTATFTSLSSSSSIIVGADSTGALNKITVGSGLSLSAGVLTATGGGVGFSLTTTGTSGLATLIGTVLNIPNYTYTLPTATASVLGGVKIGSGVTITSGVISVSTNYQAPLNGTGFVKASGTTISYDNSTYLTTGSASSTYVPYSGANASVNLGASYSMTASSFFESSDIRFKNVLETNPNISALGIDVVKFTRKGQSQVRYGYSAQQVKSILPDAVFGYDELTVNYSDVHTIKIASLEKRVAELESRLKSTI